MTVQLGWITRDQLSKNMAAAEAGIPSEVGGSPSVSKEGTVLGPRRAQLTETRDHSCVPSVPICVTKNSVCYLVKRRT